MFVAAEIYGNIRSSQIRSSGGGEQNLPILYVILFLPFFLHTASLCIAVVHYAVPKTSILVHPVIVTRPLSTPQIQISQLLVSRLSGPAKVGIDRG